MLEYLIKTKKKPCTVIFNITTDGTQVPVYLVGYDPYNANSFYFKSRFLITGQEEVTMNCPQSPSRLKIVSWSHENMPYQIASVSMDHLERVEPTDPVIAFIERFSRHAGLHRPGKYSANKIPIIIDFARNLHKQDGSEANTPARIHVDKPEIQVSKAKFDLMSIPERIVVLIHEYCHNFINDDPDDEVESDQNALGIYKELGYPKIEAMNAFGDIMPDTDENYERMQNLLNI